MYYCDYNHNYYDLFTEEECYIIHFIIKDILYNIFKILKMKEYDEQDIRSIVLYENKYKIYLFVNMKNIKMRLTFKNNITKCKIKYENCKKIYTNIEYNINDKFEQMKKISNIDYINSVKFSIIFYNKREISFVIAELCSKRIIKQLRVNLYETNLNIILNNYLSDFLNV